MSGCNRLDVLSAAQMFQYHRDARYSYQLRLHGNQYGTSVFGVSTSLQFYVLTCTIILTSALTHIIMISLLCYACSAINLYIVDTVVNMCGQFNFF